MTLSFYLPQVLSVGLNDSLSSQVDGKGKIGAASLKENVCQVRVNSKFFAFSCRGRFMKLSGANVILDSRINGFIFTPCLYSRHVR